jgi:hypothetical protein
MQQKDQRCKRMGNLSAHADFVFAAKEQERVGTACAVPTRCRSNEAGDYYSVAAHLNDVLV